MKPIKVTILDEGDTYDAYTTGDRWNGFVVPYFTKDEAERVCAWLEKENETKPFPAENVAWDSGRGTFLVTTYDHFTGEADRYDVGSIFDEAVGETLYGI